MKTRLAGALGLILLTLGSMLQAQVPPLVNYQGRVAVNGVNFDGSGAFKFALVDGGVNQNVTATAHAVVGGTGDGMGPKVLAINVTAGGSGYVVVPAVTISNINGNGAAATATVVGGVVTAISVTANGLNYGSGPTTVTIDPPPPNIVPSVSYWSNDGSSIAASEPAAAVTLIVTKGLYSVLLGNVAVANMAAVPATAFANPDVRLRVWFNDGLTGSQLLTPDQRLAPTAYLADGGVTSAALADGSVVAAKIAPAAITGSRIAPASLDFSHLAVPIAPGAGQVLGFNGTGLSWTAPGSGGGGIWALNGTTAYYNAGKVGVGTSTPAHALSIYSGPSGPLWTQSTWLGAVELTDVAAIGWRRTNGNGYAFGMGHGPTGFAMFRTASEPGTTDSPALYDLIIDNTGKVGIGTLFPVSKLEVVGQDALGLVGTQPYLTLKDSSSGNSRARIQNVNGDMNLFTESYLSGANPFSYLHIHSSTGNVGIGSATPVSKLEVVGQDALGLVGFQPYLTLKDSSSGYSGSRIQGVGGAVVFETQSYISGANSNNFARLDNTGVFSVKSLTIRGGADLAEPFAMSQRGVAPGTVVSIDPEHPGKLRMSAAAYDRKVAGIVSGANGIQPGISMIDEQRLEAGENVALSGRVFVKANASGGEIQAGDLLTTSDVPGEAMRAADHQRASGAILGKAMTPLDKTTGLVLVLVTLQ